MKCEKGPKWGSPDSDREPIFKRLARAPKPGGTAPHECKTGAIIDHGNPAKTFGQMATFSISCTTDSEVVRGIQRAVLGDPDGSPIPGPGVDLTWARFRELEALRGWSNDNRLPSHQHPTTTEEEKQPSPSTLSKAVSQLAQHIKSVHDFLPPCALLIVYSGTGDPRELARLQHRHRTFKREYACKKWDELSVRWTDEEEMALKRACRVH